jgi:SAM-dependent methyltransferase
MNVRERLAAARKKGPAYVVRKTVVVPLRALRNVLTLAFLKSLPRKTFSFDGVALPYEYQLYNTTWQNERVVEVPIGKYVLRVAGPKARILEVGNTMKHYFPHDGAVVDKYEVAPGVINADAAELALDKKYDLILSVSTIEHVGFDEEVKDPQKIRRALEVLAKHLDKGGRMFVTMPLGYNPSLDDDIRNGRLPFTRAVYMRRMNAKNEWKQVEALAWGEVHYGHPFPCANWIIVGIIEKP